MNLTLHFTHPETESPVSYAMRSYTMKIGREINGIDLTISGDPKISRYHSRIIFDPHENSFWIEDEKSTHGTIVNGVELIPGDTHELHDGDRIQLGDTDLTVAIEMKAPTVIEDDSIDHGLIRTRITMTEGAAKSIEAAGNTGTYLEMVASLQRALQNSPRIDHAVQDILEHLMSIVGGMESGGLVYPEDDTDHFATLTTVPANLAHSFSRTLARRAREDREALLWQYDTENPTRSLVENRTAWAVYAPLVADEQVWGVLYIQNQDPQKELTADDANLLAVVSYFLASHISLQRRQAVMANLQRQFSPQVAERLIASDYVRLGGERLEQVTVLMTDVRGFTRRSAEMDTADVMNTVIDMFSILTPIVFKYGGTVDKYIGDAVLAVFGCPEPDDDQCVHAVCAALEMQAAMAGHTFPIGIGIHTGEVMHGFIGSEDRMEYTVIGSTVNRAARFCDAAQPGQVVVSHEVYECLGDGIDAEPLPPMPTKHPGIEPDVVGFLVTRCDC